MIATSGRRAVGVPALAFLLVAGVLGLTVWLSSQHLEPGEAALAPRPTPRHADEVVGPWLFWDGGAYQSIADDGYARPDIETFDRAGEARIAFFPGYPFTVRAVAGVLDDTPLAMALVTFTAGLLLAVTFARWLRGRTDAGSARWSRWALLLFPWSYFLVATGYSDALFILCAVGSFVLLEDDRPVAAGVVGALASITRFVGVGVVIGLAVRAAERRGALRFDGWRPRVDRSLLRRADYGVLLAASGIAVFSAFCWVRYGDPVAFSTAQRGWGQPSGPHTWFKLQLVDLILHSPDRMLVLRLVAQGAVMLVFVAAIPSVWRRFGAGYGAYSTVVLALPAIGSAAFASNGRFVLAAFPTFALLGEHLQRWSRRRALAYMGASGTLLVLVTSFWARGYWMG